MLILLSDWTLLFVEISPPVLTTRHRSLSDGGPIGDSEGRMGDEGSVSGGRGGSPDDATPSSRSRVSQNLMIDRVHLGLDPHEYLAASMDFSAPLGLVVVSGAFAPAGEEGIFSKDIRVVLL